MKVKTDFGIRVSVILLPAALLSGFLINVIDSRLLEEEGFVSVDHAKMIILATLALNWIVATIIAWRMERTSGW